MNFRTALQLKPFSEQITYKHKILFIGSCFAENLSAYFELLRFQVQINPYGILYHPLAIQNIINWSLDIEKNQFDSLSFENEGIWSHFYAHSSLSSPDKNTHLRNLKLAKLQTQKAINESDFIFISLGTAWAYRHIKNNITVSNCHKIPQKNFDKYLMKPAVVEKAMRQIVDNINDINAEVKIIFTLSPVRHLKDGFVENQRSKSTLHLAIQNIVEQYEKVYYFPSYELLLDDLRDYRFYDDDLIHPNKLALDYIWSKFKTSFFNETTLKLLDEVDAINKRLKHRPFNPDSSTSLKFNHKTKSMIQDLKDRYPEIVF